MGLLPAALLTEIRKGLAGTPGPAVLQQWVDLGPLPDGTTWRLSSASTHAVSGPGDPRIIRGGTTRKALDPFTADPVPMTFSPEIDDSDDDPARRRRFAKLAAKYPRALRRTPVVWTIAAGGQTHPVFTGYLFNWIQRGAFRWQLQCRTDDGAINAESGASVPKAKLASYFRDLPDENKGLYASIVQGEHDSNGSGAHGFVPCFEVDPANKVWFVQSGGAKAVNVVYDDDDVVNASGYTVSRQTIAGALFTLITFGSYTPTGEIRADVEGETANTDGTGALLTNATALKNFLVQQVWGDWRGGTRLADGTAPVHAAAYTALDTFLARNGHESSMWVGGDAQRKAAEVVAEWLTSHEARGYWRHDGKLAVTAIDHYPPADIYATTFPHFEANEQEMGEFETPNDETNIAREVEAKFLKNASTGEFLQTVRVQALEVPEKIVLPLQLHNAAARAVD